jgi:hypothetical protein
VKANVNLLWSPKGRLPQMPALMSKEGLLTS